MTQSGVSLSRVEMFAAACNGVMRRLSAVKRSRCQPYGKPDLDLWGLDIESCAAEMLVAKWLGKYWNSVVERPEDLEGDVGETQVRHTPRADGRLILHDRDSDEAVFVLVVGQYPTMRIAGWIYGNEGKVKEYWWEGTGRPAYFVPQDRLYNPESLPKLENSTK